MKKNLTKKLMLSVLTLAFAVVSLGASTFAWFTLSENAQVDPFQMNVKGGAGLEIQARNVNGEFDENNWQTGSLTKEDITDLFASGLKLDSVTPNAAFGASAAQFTNLDYTNDQYNSSETANGEYVEFVIGLRLSDAYDTTEYPIAIDGYELSTVGTAAAWNVNKVFTKIDGNQAALNEPLTFKVSDAARLAVYAKNGSVTVNNVYEANAIGSNSAGFQDNGALSYYNAVNETEYTIANDAEEYYESAYADLSTSTVSLGTLTGGLTKVDNGAGVMVDSGSRQVIEVYVRIWIEGWDGEAINAIFNQTLQASLSFYCDTVEE